MSGYRLRNILIVSYIFALFFFFSPVIFSQTSHNQQNTATEKIVNALGDCPANQVDIVQSGNYVADGNRVTEYPELVADCLLPQRVLFFEAPFIRPIPAFLEGYYPVINGVYDIEVVLRPNLCSDSSFTLEGNVLTQDPEASVTTLFQVVVDDGRLDWVNNPVNNCQISGSVKVWKVYLLKLSYTQRLKMLLMIGLIDL